MLEPFVGDQQVRQPGAAGRGRPAADAGRQRHLPGLAANAAGLDGRARDYYVRQLRDWKYSAASRPWRRAACRYTAGCAAGRWPGRTPDPATGSPSPPTSASSDVFDRAIAEFAARLRRPERTRPREPSSSAVASGRVTAERDM